MDRQSVGGWGGYYLNKTTGDLTVILLTNPQREPDLCRTDGVMMSVILLSGEKKNILDSERFKSANRPITKLDSESESPAFWTFARSVHNCLFVVTYVALH